VSATVIVSGMVGGSLGQGGATWSILQYVVGLARLGHDVYLVEPVDVADLTASANAPYCDSVLREVGLGDRWCLLARDGGTAGLSRESVQAVARRADLLLNVSGMLTDCEVVAHIPVRAYLDLDPGFNQLWHAGEGIDMRLAGHTHFVTIGPALGTPGCVIPDCGVRWLRTHQPVVLEHWPRTEQRPTYGFTTVGNWRGYGSIEYGGVKYGQKVHSTRELLALPRRTRVPIHAALAIDAGETRDLDALEENGWRLIDARAASATPADYRRFLRASTAELGIAKSGYVAARCGWFSDRSVCYLASGRPVLAQDTGFPDFLPTGAGLLAFSDVDTAVAGMDAIMTDYDKHARAARGIAEDVFDSDLVLTALLDQLT
jgi:hypothetical protein